MATILDKDFRFSFSKLVGYIECPRSFWLKYCRTDEESFPIDNAYAQYGDLGHSLIERWAKGEIRAEQLAEEYAAQYPRYITASFPPFPKNYGEKAYEQGMKYFESFKGFGDMEVLEVEEKFITKIGSYTMSGIADLVYRDSAGDIIVIDHKSKSEASMKKEFSLYRKQLYIYAAHVREKFGKFPRAMKFNMFKIGTEIEVPFVLSHYEETMRWVENTIDDIYMETDWCAKRNSFRCSYICDMRDECQTQKEE